MSYFSPPTYPLAQDLFQGILSSPLLHHVSHERVRDLAYDSLSLKRFPSRIKGIIVYVCAAPFINRDKKEVDPHQFIDEAITFGATIIIYKKGVTVHKKKNIIYIPVTKPRVVLAQLSARYYALYNLSFPIIGITGTKGKTTTSFLIHHILNSLYGKTGLVGSSDYFLGSKRVENLTTKITSTRLSCMESLELAGFITMLNKKQGKAMVIESTSHALALNRVDASMNITAGIVTNIASEHLNFHKTLAAYRKAKAQLIHNIGQATTSFPKVLVLNADDPTTKYLYKIVKKYSEIHVVFVGSTVKQYRKHPTFRLLENNGTYAFIFNNNTYSLPAIVGGQYNAMNYVMAIALVSTLLKIPISKQLHTLQSFPGVPGRYEIIVTTPFSIIVDYAHEPLSMESLLAYLHTQKRNITVIFGCAGERDTTNREKMGSIAAKFATHTIITSDSSYGDDTNEILHDIKKGFKNKKNLEIIPDRYEAIKKGISILQKNDILLVLGMGDETELTINGKTIPWSDKKVILSLLANN